MSEDGPMLFNLDDLDPGKQTSMTVPDQRLFHWIIVCEMNGEKYTIFRSHDNGGIEWVRLNLVLAGKAKCKRWDWDKYQSARRYLFGVDKPNAVIEKLEG